MWKPDVCLYHFPCDDGFASAWVARRKWPDVVMAPTNYGLPLPDVDVTDKNLLIADFSYKPDVLAALAAKAQSVIMLDHHKTAQADLKDVPALGGMNCEDFTSLNAETKVMAEFDMEHSGAALTWRFCFPGDEMPLFIKLIEDRDLWRMSMPETRRFSLFLRSFPYEFEKWDAIALGMAAAPDKVLAHAEAVERFYDQRLADMLPTATLKEIGKWKGVPTAHAPYSFASDLAHELLKAHPAAPFAAVVVDAYGGRTYSLRSEDGRQDVSEVAKQFGGGGHRNAAGFRVPA